MAFPTEGNVLAMPNTVIASPELAEGRGNLIFSSLQMRLLRRPSTHSHRSFAKDFSQ
jgi:hypothetical protein